MILWEFLPGAGLPVRNLYPAALTHPKNHMIIMPLQKQFLTLAVYFVMIIHIILIITITFEGDVLVLRGRFVPGTLKIQDDHNNEIAQLSRAKFLFIHDISR